MLRPSDNGVISLKAWQLYGLVSIILVLVVLQLTNLNTDSAPRDIVLDENIATDTQTASNGSEGLIDDEATEVNAELLSNVTSNCIVLDPDIAGSYDGDCLDGLAHGNGTAIGRDSYIGAFESGKKQGLGIYSWGDDSDWPSMTQEGEWFNDDQVGYIEVFVDANETAEGNAWVKESGRREGDKFVVRIIRDDTSGVYYDCSELNSGRACYSRFMEETILPTIPDLTELISLIIPDKTAEGLVCISNRIVDVIMNEGLISYQDILTEKFAEESFFGCIFSLVPKTSFYDMKANISETGNVNEVFNVDGQGQYILDTFRFSDNKNGTVTIPVDIDTLYGTNKQEIYSKCSNVLEKCNVTVIGLRRNVGFSPGIVAMRVNIH